jgi:RimJ/RimL family protein N-acetyltransferase
MEIRSERLLLRAWRRGDEAALVRHGNNHAVWKNLTDRFPHPYTRKDAVTWIRRVRAQGLPPQSLAIVYEDEPVGGVGFERMQDLSHLTAEFGYWISEAFWGRGFATEAARCASAYAFTQFDFERLQASVLEWNKSSCRVLEKVGFSLEGRLRRHCVKEGRVVDSFVYGLLRHELDARSTPAASLIPRRS